MQTYWINSLSVVINNYFDNTSMQNSVSKLNIGPGYLTYVSNDCLGDTAQVLSIQNPLNVEKIDEMLCYGFKFVICDAAATDTGEPATMIW